MSELTERQAPERLRWAGLTLFCVGLVVSLSQLSGCGGGSSSSSTTASQQSGSSSSNSSSGGTKPTETVSVSPQNVGLVSNQQVAISATTSDTAGVTWSTTPSGGSFSPTSSKSGVSVTFTAPSIPGVYTITATSVSNSSDSSSATVGVTNLAGVYTYHDDPARDGANTTEYALTPANVNTMSFGKLFSCTVDGAIYAQPLWVAGVTVNGAKHNIVIVATEHDSLFAFDADTSPCSQLWTVSLIDSNHGGTSGEVPVSDTPGDALVGAGYGDVSPEIGVTGTPVIDPSTGILYVVSKSVSSTAGLTFYQRLHAIDITSGAEKSGSPLAIQATFPGTGDGGTTDSFNEQQENQRPGLALVNGTVYVAWSSHEDAKPYYGWIIGYQYNGSSLVQTQVFNDAPNNGQGGIWMSGGALAADSSNNLYVVTGNAVFDANSATAPNNDYGDSLLQLSPSLQVLQYFAPSDEATDESEDNDFGAGGATVLADLPAGSPVVHIALAGGKDGNLYVFNRDNLGGLGDGNAWQEISVGAEDLSSPNAGVIFATGAFWNNYFYLAGAGGPLQAYQLNTTSAKFSLVSAANSPAGGFGYPGSSPSVSASGTTNGIVWVLDTSAYCTGGSSTCGPAVLHAYNATSVSTELWNSSMVSTDAAGNAVKFVVPTVANGKVYVATRGNNAGGVDGSTSVPGELDVYGLKPN